jgi:hypothetical protein
MTKEITTNKGTSQCLPEANYENKFKKFGFGVKMFTTVTYT